MQAGYLSNIKFITEMPGFKMSLHVVAGFFIIPTNKLMKVIPHGLKVATSTPS